jgi:hypothetical protein
MPMLAARREGNNTTPAKRVMQVFLAGSVDLRDSQAL